MQTVSLPMRHSPTGSDQGGQSQVLVTGSLNRPRQAKVRNQAWGPSRGPRQSGAAGGRTGNKDTVEIQGPSGEQG